MQRYLARRLLLLVPTLLLASVLIFAIITLSPGDPVRMMLGTQATPEEIAVERERLGLDKPVPVRYAIWLSDVTQLNLGMSQSNRRPVADLIADALPYTLRLALISLAVAMLIGFPLGIVAAVNANRRLDAMITGFNSLGLSMPTFWFGLLLILLFAVQLKWLPASGVGEPGRPLYERLHYLIMPVATIAVSNMSVFSRYVRSAMIDVLSADYVRTARAKGLAEKVVVTRHALRNAMIPVITIVGIQFGRLLGGAVVTESVFAYPGIGRLVINSIQNRDYPVVQATLMLVVLIFLITNIIVDASYAYLDPRVKLERAR
ncbi:MAG TPA: ABC transporter permease [Chloroflexota bacterium]|nr:ABC transporter permease [Chloroflexota bacterium]